MCVCVCVRACVCVRGPLTYEGLLRDDVFCHLKDKSRIQQTGTCGGRGPTPPRPCVGSALRTGWFSGSGFPAGPSWPTGARPRLPGVSLRGRGERRSAQTASMSERCGHEAAGGSPPPPPPPLLPPSIITPINYKHSLFPSSLLNFSLGRRPLLSRWTRVLYR